MGYLSESAPLICFWFRYDLRLADHPALVAAARQGAILPIFILDPRYAMGEASRWWLHHSLQALQKSLKGNLHLYQGKSEAVLQTLLNNHPIEALYSTHVYEPNERAIDQQVARLCKEQNISWIVRGGRLLWEPWEILKQDGTPYKVFTPFYQRGCLGAPPPAEPLPAPFITFAKASSSPKAIEDLHLLPKHPWHERLKKWWQPGEEGAHARLNAFLKNQLSNYATARDFPSQEGTSRLSPHLHFGEISPHTIWHQARRSPPSIHQQTFLKELGWREFSHHLLYHFPDLSDCNWQKSFDRFPWGHNTDLLKAWQKGKTGYPIVDAGMRELWQTGYMHNRVRMIVGSFLVKNLLLHWHHGRDWFWDCLVDADLANNSASWQWVAGSGADAAPYFRIFNPVLQGEKFDPKGQYIRRFVPELSSLEDRYLFAPWQAPQQVLEAAGITLGTTYPLPIVDLAASRQAALAAYQTLS